jgi:hypothetical protein
VLLLLLSLLLLLLKVACAGLCNTQPCEGARFKARPPPYARPTPHGAFTAGATPGSCTSATRRGVA